MTNTAPTSKKFRTVFLGTPEIARNCLASLLKCAAFEVVGVVSQPDRPAGRKMQLQASAVKKLALDNGIEVLTPEKVNADVIEKMRSWKPDVAIVVAFGQILPQSFLDLMPGNVVNLHTSLLPRWRGAAPVQRAIMAGDKKTGVCLQAMVKKLDAGDIIASYETTINDLVNAVELLEQLGAAGSRLIESELPRYLNRALEAYPVKPQDETLVTYAHKIEKSESLINWNLAAREIHNKVRGMILGPGTHTVLKASRLKIHRTEIVDEVSIGSSGVVAKADADGIVVQCAGGKLRVTELQPESSPKMKAREYLLGHPLKVGEKFE